MDLFKIIPINLHYAFMNIVHISLSTKLMFIIYFRYKNFNIFDYENIFVILSCIYLNILYW